MKAFIVSLIVIGVILATVVTSSAVGIRRIDEYLDLLPSEDLPPSDALGALLSLKERILSELFLLNHLFHHERIDELSTAVRRAEGAARMGNEDEYAILRNELQSILDNMRRDLTPHLSDII